MPHQLISPLKSLAVILAAGTMAFVWSVAAVRLLMARQVFRIAEAFVTFGTDVFAGSMYVTSVVAVSISVRAHSRSSASVAHLKSSGDEKLAPHCVHISLLMADKISAFERRLLLVAEDPAALSCGDIGIYALATASAELTFNPVRSPAVLASCTHPTRASP